MAKRKLLRIPISESALVKRINRQLSEEGERLRKARTGSRQASFAGRFYRTDGTRVIDRDVDVVALGRRLGVLQDYETVDGLEQAGAA